MQVVDTIAALQSLADTERSAGLRIALVPTMGALHDGHLSLIDAARERADRVWVSIFVNPTQFNDVKDLDAYPRTFEADLRACEERAVDAVFAPTAAEMYPAGYQTHVEVSELAKPLCGATRPGHFRGVATVVTKLLLAARPHVAVFGEKDYQQLAVLRRLERDLGFGVEIVGSATVREPDGLALSSRNARLSPESRRQATALVRALEAAESAVAAGSAEAGDVLHSVQTEIEKSPLAEIDYTELRHPDTLEPLSGRIDTPALLALAVFFPAQKSNASPPSAAQDRVRLIDNRVLWPRAADLSPGGPVS